MKRLETRPTFFPAAAAGPLRRIPAGIAGGALLVGQLALLVAHPITLTALWALLLTACAVGRRPVVRVLLRAWPILFLAAITALRRAGMGGTDASASLLSHASLIWLRFCWMVIAADLFVSSFAWQSSLAALATHPTHHRTAGVIVRARTTAALALWLAVIQLPLIVGVLRSRREAVRARGLLGPRALITSMITGVLPHLLHRADTYAETLAARGIGPETAISGTARNRCENNDKRDGSHSAR